jgi:hypothetical protein
MDSLINSNPGDRDMLRTMKAQTLETTTNTLESTDP